MIHLCDDCIHFTSTLKMDCNKLRAREGPIRFFSPNLRNAKSKSALMRRFRGITLNDGCHADGCQRGIWNIYLVGWGSISANDRMHHHCCWIVLGQKKKGGGLSNATNQISFNPDCRYLNGCQALEFRDWKFFGWYRLNVMMCKVTNGQEGFQELKNIHLWIA